jgi:hypothetical protein
VQTGKIEWHLLLEIAAQEFKEPEALKISALESIVKVCKKLEWIISIG